MSPDEFITRIKRWPDGRQTIYIDTELFAKKNWLGKKVYDIDRMLFIMKWISETIPNSLVMKELEGYQLCIGNRRGTMWEPTCG